MRYLISLLALLLLALSISVTAQEPTPAPTRLGECIHDWQFVNAKHQRIYDLASDIPVVGLWIGYGQYSQSGQEGMDTPLFSEMTQRYWILSEAGGLQVALAFYTHPDTPDTVYIFPVTALASADGGNHGVCNFYRASLRDVRVAGIRW